jgi:ornithine cyclodeaminase
MITINGQEVARLLTMEKCEALMRGVLSGLAAGKYLQPLRSILRLPGENLFGFMPASLGDGDYFGAKLVTAFHRNTEAGLPSHMGYVLLFEPEHGNLVAMVDATKITEIRTGAVSGVATGLLARKDAHTLALIGAGAQARSHLAAIRLVRDLRQVTVYDLDRDRADIFAREVEREGGPAIVVAASAEEAVTDADIVCTLTTSAKPFLRREWIKPGTHINAVGAFSPDRREVASDLVAASRLFADQVDAMRKECGEYLVPLMEGLIGEDHIKGAIGDVILGLVPGRTNDAEITLFDALGQAAEDVACAKSAFLASQR